MHRSLAILVIGLLTVGAVFAQNETVVVRTSTLLDGKGRTLEGRDIVIADGRIRAVRMHSGEADIDLTGLTVLPGLIDTHVHLGWHFGADGKIQIDDSEPLSVSALYAAENAYKTLMAGVTTVQSLGAPIDKPVRDAVARGILPGPRILTAIQPIGAETGGPDELIERVQELHAEGADVIKIFASKSIRDAGVPTLSQEQLDAACGEARRLGLRSVVHAHGPVSARRSALAGCTAIEHGALLDRETLSLLAEKGVYFDPNVGLVVQNYLENKDRYLGIGNYTEEGFRHMERAKVTMLEVFKTGLEIEKLKMVFGTDATAGAHGQNVRELLVRAKDGGQDPQDVIIGATSLAAESLGMEDRIGSIEAGMEADLIAVEGNPHEDIDALARVRFVMRAGTVFKE